jgi:hypothetical protein
MSHRQPASIETRDAGRQQAVTPLLQPNSDLFRAAITRFRKAQGVLECQLRGGSMGQAIPAGSRIRISFVDPASYHTGQVIAFLTGNSMCVHRIVYCGRWRRARHYLLTQGDRCLLPDAPVSVTSVLGPVTEYAQEGPWQPPATPQRRQLIPRLSAFVVLMALAAGLEIHVQMAQWLAVQLWRAERLCARVRARVQRRATRAGRA